MRTAPPPPSLLVDVAVAKRQPVTFMVHTQGAVTPRTSTTLVSEVSGQIVEVAPAFVKGGFFGQGDVLVRIDPRNYQTALKRARSEVAKARTKVATEHALAAYAYEDWQRLRSLDATEAQASDLALRKPQLAEAVAGLEFAEADLEKATEDLDRTVIRAPYDGMVRDKRADVGQYVNVGTALADTFAIDYAEVRLPLPQSELQYLHLPRQDSPPLPVSLQADIGGVRHSWDGRVVRTEGVFDADSRVLHVVAQVDDPYNMKSAAHQEPLRIGTFVTAAIEGRDGGDLFVIPRHSLQRGRSLWPGAGRHDHRAPGPPHRAPRRRVRLCGRRPGCWRALHADAAGTAAAGNVGAHRRRDGGRCGAGGRGRGSCGGGHECERGGVARHRRLSR